MRIIDLSAPITPSPEGTPEFQRNDIAFFDHADGARTIEQLYCVPSRLLRDGEVWPTETVTPGTHNPPHVDAQYHYNSTFQGRPSETIDELPHERFFGPGDVLDFTDKEDGDAITAAQMEQALDAAGHTLRE